MVKNLPASGGDTGSVPGYGRSPGGRKWQCTPVFLPGKSHVQRCLGGYSQWDRPNSPALHAEQLCFPIQTHKEPRFACVCVLGVPGRRGDLKKNT